MKNQYKTLLFVLFVSVFISTAKAQDNQTFQSKIIEIDTIDEDISNDQRCDDNAQAMSACRSFIKGFIQGALLTDAAIITSIETSESSFAERAFKTRVGSRFNQSPTALAGFCLPEDRTVLDLVEETLEHIKDAERDSVELAKRVYESLKIDYQC